MLTAFLVTYRMVILCQFLLYSWLAMSLNLISHLNLIHYYFNSWRKFWIRPWINTTKFGWCAIVYFFIGMETLKDVIIWSIKWDIRNGRGAFRYWHNLQSQKVLFWHWYCTNMSCYKFTKGLFYKTASIVWKWKSVVFNYAAKSVYKSLLKDSTSGPFG